MKVSTTHGDFVVNAISFKDRRELHKLEIQAISVDGQVETGSFYNILEWVVLDAVDAYFGKYTGMGNEFCL